MGGSQHPAYEMAVSGTGDVVLTDLRGTAAVLTLPARAQGRFFIRDRDNRLVVELAKQPGAQVDIGLETGTYSVAVVFAKEWSGTEVTVQASAQTTLDVTQLKPIAAATYATRGDEVTGERAPPPSAVTWRTQIDVSGQTGGNLNSAGTITAPVTASYFLTPLRDDALEPLGTLRFLQHPDLISLGLWQSFGGVPVLSPTLSASFYPWSSTGLHLTLGVVSGLGPSGFLSAAYGVGVDHYFTPRFSVRLDYAGRQALRGVPPGFANGDARSAGIGTGGTTTHTAAATGTWLAGTHWLFGATVSGAFAAGSALPAGYRGSSGAAGLNAARLIGRHLLLGLALTYSVLSALGDTSNGLSASTRVDWYATDWLAFDANYGFDVITSRLGVFVAHNFGVGVLARF